MTRNDSGQSSGKTMLKAALEYAEIGWKVFPLAVSGDIKAPHPYLTSEGHKKGSRGQHAGTDNPRTIRDWWKEEPSAGIGVNCEASGLVVVDVDPRKAGDKTLKRLREQHPGVFESSVVGETGGGGLHLFFAAEPGARYPGTLGPGIDVKLRGYVVLPPSPHPSGTRYAWAAGKTPEEGDALMPRLSAALCQEIRETGRSGRPLRGVEHDSLVDVDDDDPFSDLTDDRPLGLTYEQIRKIVFAIPNEGHMLTDDEEEYVKAGARSYDDWFEVLCGIYHETGGSEEGKQIALEWSEQAAVHTLEKFEKSWASAYIDGKGFRPKTFRSVIAMSNRATREEREQRFEALRQRFIEATSLDEVAEAVKDSKSLALTSNIMRRQLAAEYRAAAKRITHAPIITLAQAMKDIQYDDPTLTNVPDWCRNICFITSENVFFDYRDGELTWTKQAFDNTFMRHAMTEEEIRQGLTRPAHLPSDLALTRYAVKTVRARGYLPWDRRAQKDPFYEQDGRLYVNTYHSRFAAKMPKGEFDAEERDAIETYRLFLRTVFPVERDQGIINSYLKYGVHVGKRVGWAPVFYSVEGIGKTLLFNLIGSMVGRNNVSLITGMALHEKFNGWAEHRLFAFIEEVGGFDRKERFDTMNALKPIITNDYITIRRMHREPYETFNTVNVIMTTNKVDAFDFAKDGGDTRIWVPTPGFRTQDELEAFKRDNPSFYVNVVDAFTFHAGAIKRWLKEQPYHPDFRPGSRAPASEMKKEMVTESKSEEQLAIEDAIAEGLRPDVSNELLRVDALAGVLAEIDPSLTFPDYRVLNRLLRALGFTRLGRLRTGGRDDPRAIYWSRTPSRFLAGSRPDRKAIEAWLADRDDAL